MQRTRQAQRDPTGLPILPSQSRITCLSYNAKGKELYTGGEDCQIRVWDIVTEERKKTFYGHK